MCRSLNKTGRSVRAWRECTGERDRLIFYDGASTDDPVLLEYCGGDWLPRVAARGPDMLVAFHSSPYSAPPRAAPAHAPLRGFELDVDVIFADSDSLDYARCVPTAPRLVRTPPSPSAHRPPSVQGGAALRVPRQGVVFRGGVQRERAGAGPPRPPARAHAHAAAQHHVHLDLPRPPGYVAAAHAHVARRPLTARVLQVTWCGSTSRASRSTR